MQAKVEKEMGAGQDPASAAVNQENKHEVDSRSVFVGNFSPKEMEMATATGSKRKARRDDEVSDAVLARHYRYLEIMLEYVETMWNVDDTFELEEEEHYEPLSKVLQRAGHNITELYAGSKKEEEDAESDFSVTVEELEKEDDHEIDEPLKGDNNGDAVEDDKNVEIDAIEDYKDDDEVEAGRKRVRVSGPSVGKSDKEGCDNSTKKAKVGHEDNSAETQTAVQ